jgi:uncharacterized membrane protein YhaH (DUF805 family)
MGVQMNFADAVKTVLTQKYADFNGRATRSEFWWWVLFAIIVSVVLQLVDNLILGFPLLGSIFALATLIPGVAVSVRRLHDKDKSGWWLFISLVPVVGFILLIYWYATEGTPGDNQFGSPPVL